MEFRNAYERCQHKGIVFSEPSKTQQSFKDDVDINKTIDRYTATGVVPAELVNDAVGVYGDFTDYSDFTDLQNRLARAQQSFEALPSAVRDRFNNDPAELVRFVRDKNNYDEALKLGLVNERPELIVNPEKPADSSE